MFGKRPRCWRCKAGFLMPYRGDEFGNSPVFKCTYCGAFAAPFEVARPITPQQHRLWRIAQHPEGELIEGI